MDQKLRHKSQLFLIKFEQVWSSLNKFDHVDTFLSNLIKFHQYKLIYVWFKTLILSIRINADNISNLKKREESWSSRLKILGKQYQVFLQCLDLTGSRITCIIRNSCRCFKEGQLEWHSTWKTVNLEEGQLEFLVLGFWTPIHKFQFLIHDIWTQYPQKSKFLYLKFGTPIHRNQSLNLNLKECQLEFPIHDIGTPIHKNQDFNSRG